MLELVSKQLLNRIVYYLSLSKEAVNKSVFSIWRVPLVCIIYKDYKHASLLEWRGSVVFVFYEKQKFVLPCETFALNITVCAS